MEMSSVVAIAGAALAAAATVAEGYGEYQEGKYQSRVQKANAEVMQQNAARKRLETSINEDVMREENRRRIAKNEAAMIEQGSISPTGIGVLGQQATDLEQNVLNSRYQGLAAAEAQDIESYYLRQNAKWTKRSAKNKFLTTLLFKAPANAFSTYKSMGGSFSGNTNNQVTQTGGTSSSFRTYNIGG